MELMMVWTRARVMSAASGITGEVGASRIAGAAEVSRDGVVASVGVEGLVSGTALSADGAPGVFL